MFRPRTYGVKCVIQRGDRWLMIKNTYGRSQWTFPGGAVDRGEEPRDAAIREVREEVGIALGDVQPIGDYFTRRQYKRDTVYCFTASVDREDFVIDEGEISEARWFESSNLPEVRSASVDSILAMLEKTS